MKAVMLSLRPQWCEKIFNGKKTIEVRKTRPKIETPFKCYIYMTATKERCRLWEYITAYQNSKGDILNGSQKVIGEFVCDRIVDIKINSDDCGNYWHEWNDECDIEDMCLSYEELETYLGKFIGYGWHITEPQLFDKPRELGEFKHKIKVPWAWQENGKAIGYFYKRQPITRAPQSWVYCETIDER